MPIQFPCPGCKNLMQAGEQFAGKKVRCPKCQTISVVPEDLPVAVPLPPEPEPPVLETADAPEAERYTRLEALPATAPSRRPARSRRSDDDREERPSRQRRPQPTKVMSLAMALTLVIGGLFILLVIVGVGCWLYFSVSRPLATVKPRDGIGGLNPDLRDPPGEVKIVIQEPPIEVKLDNGRFETVVNLDRPADGPGQQVTRRHLFEGKAGTVYWVQIRDNPTLAVSVEGPNGPVRHPADPLGQNRQTETAFLAPRTGPYVVRIDCDGQDHQPCRLTIRAMDGTEPLPNNLKLPPENVELPRIEQLKALDVYAKQFSSAAFAPDNSSFWMAHGDGTLTFWELPAIVQKGSYKTPEQRLFAMAVDKQGRLYAQTTTGDRGPLSVPQRPVGDLSVWENLKPTKDNLPLPVPTRTIPIHGIVKRTIPSADGAWLYCLDVHNRRLCRIDATTATIDRKIDNLSDGAVSFCLTPDGKKIYCCATSNKLDVIDVAEFKLMKTVSLDRGKPGDVAASNEGMVFLVGENVADPATVGRCTCMLVDLTRGNPDRANVMPVNVGHDCLFVSMLPEQRAALFSGDRKVSPCSLPAQPALFRTVSREQSIRDYFMPGQIVLSPDGRTLLQDTGVILSVKR